ncbi:ubiquitin-associated protein 1-like protein [Dinothrombium tinctorium]|uniref:Ubiquitin-associated protein 1-like protein n=1 Tax=Dinothrombium tinctorium TaxID=1965070 RepID=A0A443RJ58_9ACAR|nr:ubiquitin-associated protein 1-like protein [Dinothrombium tinctorium]
MSTNKTEITSYVDDIPMKISESFKPRNFNTSAFTAPQISDIDNENFVYSFKVELYALEVAELKKQQEEERRLRLQTEKESIIREQKLDGEENEIQSSEIAITSCEDSNVTDVVSSSNAACIERKGLTVEKNKCLPSGPKFENFTQEILKPQISTNSDQFKSNFIPIKPINPADFESSNSSPFDDALLNAIDDKQELNRVFQQFYGVKSNSDKNYSYSQSQTSVVFSHMNGVSFRTNDATGAPYVNHRFYEQPNQLHSYYNHQIDKQLPEYVQQDISGNSFQVNCSIPQSFPLRSSKSTSDLQTVSNEKYIDNADRSRTPPLQTLAMTKPKSLSQYSSLPNPYSELSSDLKNFVNRICEMGFAEGRVARATQHLGNDEKKAKQFLTNLRQLCEVGFKRQAVIKALLKQRCDRDQALEQLLANQY